MKPATEIRCLYWFGLIGSAAVHVLAWITANQVWKYAEGRAGNMPIVESLELPETLTADCFTAFGMFVASGLIFALFQLRAKAVRRAQ